MIIAKRPRRYGSSLPTQLANRSHAQVRYVSARKKRPQKQQRCKISRRSHIYFRQGQCRKHLISHPDLIVEGSGSQANSLKIGTAIDAPSILAVYWLCDGCGSQASCLRIGTATAAPTISYPAAECGGQLDAARPRPDREPSKY